MPRRVLSRPRSAWCGQQYSSMSDSVLTLSVVLITSCLPALLAPTVAAYTNTQYRPVRQRAAASCWAVHFYLSRPARYQICLFFPLSGSGTEGTKPSLRLRFDTEIRHRPTLPEANKLRNTLPYTNSSQSERSILQLVSFLLLSVHISQF